MQFSLKKSLGFCQKLGSIQDHDRLGGPRKTGQGVCLTIQFSLEIENHVKETTELEIGQLWKVGDFHIEIVQIGKTLCHYRHLRNLGQKGIPVKLEQLQVVKKYLKTNKAELVGNKKKKTAKK